MRANFAGADAAEQPVQTAEATGTSTDESTVAIEGLQRGNIAADASSGDAMQHYLREISVAELLTREQEVELAQRIEAGRAAMLAALCRSEVLRGAIKQWREGLAKNAILLRDVVDLAATRQRLKGDIEAPVDETGTASALTQLEAELMPDVTAAFARAVKVGRGRPKALAAALADIVLQPAEADRLAHRIKEASRRLMELEGTLVRLTQ